MTARGPHRDGQASGRPPGWMLLLLALYLVALVVAALVESRGLPGPAPPLSAELPEPRPHQLTVEHFEDTWTCTGDVQACGPLRRPLDQVPQKVR